MRFLVDAQLPPVLARWLGERGHSATAVREAGLRDSDDGSIWNFEEEAGLSSQRSGSADGQVAIPYSLPDVPLLPDDQTARRARRKPRR